MWHRYFIGQMSLNEHYQALKETQSTDQRPGHIALRAKVHSQSRKQELNNCCNGQP